MFPAKLARLLVAYSTAVRPGQVVSLTGSPQTEPLLTALYREVLCAGGHPVVHMRPTACRDLLYQYGSSTQLTFVDPLERHSLTDADAFIQVHTLEGMPTSGPADLERRLLHGRARQPLRDELRSRTARQTLRWVVTAFPCPAAAQGAGLTLPAYERLLAVAQLLDQDEPAAAWQALSERQARLIDFLSRVHELRFVTRAGTDLRVGVEGRRWINDDGHENLPDGEVFTAPLTDAIDGPVCFDVPSVQAGRVLAGIRLIFRAGRVVEATAQTGQDVLHTLLEQDEGARGVGEVALGCNYALRQPTRHPLLDEKIGGTFHLGLGAAHPATGSSQTSALHWDLVSDLRPGGQVYADGQVISVAGRFVRADWPRAGA